MQYLFCSLGENAIAFPMETVDLLHAADEAPREISVELYNHFKLPVGDASVVVSPRRMHKAWQVDRPICLCDVPKSRFRSIPKLILPKQSWTTGVIAAGDSLHHQLKEFPLAWVVDPMQLLKD